MVTLQQTLSYFGQLLPLLEGAGGLLGHLLGYQTLALGGALLLGRPLGRRLGLSPPEMALPMGLVYLLLAP